MQCDCCRSIYFEVKCSLLISRNSSTHSRTWFEHHLLLLKLAVVAVVATSCECNTVVVDSTASVHCVYNSSTQTFRRTVVQYDVAAFTVIDVAVVKSTSKQDVEYKQQNNSVSSHVGCNCVCTGTAT